jgi:hypothetical protein
MSLLDLPKPQQPKVIKINRLKHNRAQSELDFYSNYFKNKKSN